MTLDVLYFAAAICLGAIVGSFLNVVILRLPIVLGWIEAGDYLSKGRRSMCPKCGAPIRWFDNVPVLSFLVLGAKGRCCRQPISWRYPLVELVTAGLFAWLYVATRFPVIEQVPVLPGSRITDPALSAYPGMVAFAFYACFVALLVASSFIDWDHRSLPDVLDLPGAALGVVGAALVPGLAGGMGVDPDLARGALGGAAAGFAALLLLGVAAVLRPSAAPGADPDAVDAMPPSPTDDLAADDGVPGVPLAPPATTLALLLGFAACGLMAAAVAAGQEWIGVALYGAAALPIAWGLRCLWSWASTRQWALLGHAYFTDRVGLALAVACVAAGAAAGWSWRTGAPPWIESVRFSLLGVLTGVALTAGIRALATKVFRQEAMGFGDVKFMGMIGAFVGWEGALLTFFLASLFGALGGTVHRLVTGDAKVPFGPFLAMGGVCALLYQRAIREFVLVDWPKWVQGSRSAPWIVIGLGVLCLFLMVVVVRKGRRGALHTTVREE